MADPTPRNPRRAPVCRALAAGFALLWVGACAAPETDTETRAGGTDVPSATSAQGPEQPVTPDAAAEPGQAQSAAGPQDDPAPEAGEPAGQAAPPTTLRIPHLDIDEELIDLGLADDGSMEVPQDAGQAGWFTGGGRPGGYGPTVLAGHVDSDSGPAVFYRLTEMQPGDEVEVERADGVVVTYEVTEVADYDKGEFPTAQVFGATAEDTLRLITCTGPWDSLAESYEDNRVVYATATAATPPAAAG